MTVKLAEQRRLLKVLVLDDNDRMRKVVAFTVELNMGISPLLASSAKEALEMMDWHHIDVVISDLFMPEMDGFQFLLQSRRRFPLTKVVLVSSDFDAFSVKPRTLLAEGALSLIPRSEITSTLIECLRKVGATL